MKIFKIIIPSVLIIATSFLIYYVDTLQVLWGSIWVIAGFYLAFTLLHLKENKTK